jgi:hypothetical protein
MKIKKRAKQLIEAYSAADLGKVFQLVRQLEAEGITDTYAIGGAVGASFYAQLGATQDVDVFITFPSTGLLLDPSKVNRWLTQRGAKAVGEHMMISGWPVQFLPAGNDLVKEALSEAVIHQTAAGPVRVFTAEHLAAIALQLNRDKDRLRLPGLVNSADFNPRKFTDILRRHSLLARWKLFNAA